MKKIGTFLTSILAALTLAGVGIGVGQSLTTNEKDNIQEAVTPPNTSKSFSLYFDSNVDFIQGKKVDIDLYHYDKENEGVNTFDAYFATNAIITDMSFTECVSGKSDGIVLDSVNDIVESESSGTYIDDGLYRHLFYLATDPMESANRMDTFIPSGKLGTLSFTIPASMTGNFKLEIRETRITTITGEDYEQDEGDIDVSKAIIDKTILTNGGGSSNTSSSSSANISSSTVSNSNSSSNNSSSSQTAGSNPGGNNGEFDPSKVNSKFALYFNKIESLPKGTKVDIDLYHYDKENEGVNTFDAYFATNAIITDMSFTECVSGKSDGIVLDSVNDIVESESSGTYIDDGLYRHLFYLATDPMESANRMDTFIPSGKLGTLSFTIPASMTGNFKLEIRETRITTITGEDYEQDEGDIDVEYSKFNVPLVASSSDTSIKVITVDSKAASSSGNTYSVTTQDYSKSTAAVNVTFNDPTTKVESFTVGGSKLTASSGIYNVSLGTPGSKTTATIVVKAQDGTTKTYTLEIIRAKSNDNSLKSLEITQTGSSVAPKLFNQAGNTEISFHESITNYVIKISENTTKLTFKPTSIDTYSTIKINGTSVTSDNTLDVSNLSSNVTIEVISQKGETKTYTFAIQKLSDNTDATITVKDNNNVNIPLNQTGTTFVSKNNVDYTVNSFTVNVNTASNATVSYSTSKTFTFNDKNAQTGTITVKVTSESGVVKSYTVEVTRNAANTSADFSIIVTGENDGKVYTKTSSSTSTIYVYEIPQSAGRAVITASAYADTTTVSGLGTYNIPSTGINIIATAQSGLTKSIQVNITSGKDTNNDIDSIKVLDRAGGNEITGTDGNKIIFNASTQEYNLTVPYNVSTIYIDVKTHSSTASLIGAGLQSLNAGKNTFKVYARSESGVSGKQYTINVTKEAALSNCTVDKIVVGTTELKTFTNTGGSNYAANDKVYVNRDTNTVNVNVVFESDSVTAKVISGNGTSKTLSNGSNNLTVRVQAQDGSTRDYTFEVIKGDRINTIDSISLSSPSDASYVFPFTFDPATKEYTIAVPYEVSSVKISAVATSGHATLTGVSNAEALVQGVEKTFTIYATSESKEKGQEYKIKITRALPQTGNTLDGISVGGQLLNMSDFKGTANSVLSEVPVYVDRDVENVSVLAVLAADSNLAKVNGNINVQSLTMGKNEMILTVVPQDGINIKSYKFYVYRGERDNTITNISISAINDFHFDPTQTLYPATGEYVVQYSVSSVNVVVSTNAEHATVFGVDASSGGNVVLPSGNVKVIKVYLENEIGEKGKEYTIRIKRESSTESDPPKISNIKVVGSDSKNYYDFDETNTSERIITVPYNVTGVTVTVARPAGSNNIAFGDGTYSLIPGAEQVITCYVALPDGTDQTQTYIIKITREKPSSDNTLKDIIVDGKSLEDFNSANDEYTVYKPHGATSVTIQAVTNDLNSTASISGGNWTVALTGIKKDLSITVLAQDGSTKTYKLTVLTGERENAITDIIIDDISSDLFDFDKTVTTYPTFSVPYTVTDLDITAFASGSYSQVKIEGNENLKVGTNKILVYALNEIGEKGTVYTINVERKAAGQNSELSSLKYDGQLIEGFKSDTTNYTIYVPHGTPGLTFDATPADANSVVTAGNVYKALNNGRNQHTIVVTAEDGSTTTYVVTIYCGERKNTITNIDISNLESGQFTFVQDRLQYDVITVPYKTQYVDITVDYDGIYGKINGDGTRNLLVGKNTLNIFVTDEIGNNGEVYEIVIIREDVDKNNNLQDLAVYENGINKIDNFDPSLTAYVLQLGDKTTSITIDPVLESSKATLSGDYGVINLSKYSGQLASGNVIILTVTVTAENGDKKDYKISVSRQKVDFSDDNTISGITIDGSDGNTYFGVEFNQNVFDYRFDVPYNIQSLTVRVNATATIITGAKTYVFDATNVLEFVVYATSDSGLKGYEYKFKITREEANDETNLDFIKINGETIEGFSSSILTYNIKKPNSVKSIDVTVGISSTTSRYDIVANGVSFGMVGMGIELNEGVNVISISVFAQSGNYQTYILNVTRQSNKPTLKSLDVENHALLDKLGQNIVFNEEILEYYVSVPYEVTSVTITAETWDPTVSWRLYYANGKKLSIGQNIAFVYALPEDSEIPPTQYTIYITRKTRITDSVNVGGITIENAPGLDLNFKNDVYNYQVVVPSNITNLDLNVSFDVAAGDTAPIYSVIGNEKLHFGTNNVVVVATASNGINKVIYVIEVEREEVALSNASIDKIGDFKTDFSNEQNSYSYQVNGLVSSLDIKFTPDNEGTTYLVSENAHNLKKGTNRITIDVFSNGVLAKQITLNVTRGDGLSTLFDITKEGLVAIFATTSSIALIGVIVTFAIVRTYKRKRG